MVVADWYSSHSCICYIDPLQSFARLVANAKRTRSVVNVTTTKDLAYTIKAVNLHLLQRIAGWLKKELAVMFA